MDKPRAARPTIKFIDEYCTQYRNLFPEVRSFEAFKHRKNELGWADFRLTQYQDIEKWWEIVYSGYLLVSLFADSGKTLEKLTPSISCPKVRELFRKHALRGSRNWLEKLA